MEWIYLSPHLDDVALSCGGLVWEQVQRGEPVSIWTICAGDPTPGVYSPFATELHARWQTGPEAVQLRRQEDLAACAALGATALHLSVPDCIYRWRQDDGFFYYASELAIFGELHPDEIALVEALHQELASRLPTHAQLVCPLSLGGHVDHRLTRRAAEKLGRSMLYYPDYPYVLWDAQQLPQSGAADWQTLDFEVSSAGLQAWQTAVAAHASQISSFWPDLNGMQTAIQAYAGQVNGVRLWGLLT